MIRIKSPAMISKMKESGAFVYEFLQRAKEITKPGISTYEYEILAIDFCNSKKITPSFYLYSGFPARVCVSVNEEIIHGIPSKEKILQDGDIVSVDFGAFYNGFHGDSAISILVGNGKNLKNNNAIKLLKVTEEALNIGLSFVKPGNTVGDIGYAIQKHAELNGFGVIRDFVGHGIGESLHEEPQIPNFGRAGSGPKLKKGMTLAIEPMVVEGSINVKVLKDKWTAVTTDGGLACHFEHTVVVSESGFEILTKPLK